MNDFIKSLSLILAILVVADHVLNEAIVFEQLTLKLLGEPKRLF